MAQSTATQKAMDNEFNELRAELERLRAENTTLKTENAKRTAVGVTFKVSDKGALSAYGLGRFPVTLYREQWERLLAKSDELKAFIAANVDKLSVKER